MDGRASDLIFGGIFKVINLFQKGVLFSGGGSYKYNYGNLEQSASFAEWGGESVGLPPLPPGSVLIVFIPPLPVLHNQSDCT